MTGEPNGAPSDAAVQAAAEVLAHAEAAAAQMTPREQAEAAYESDDIATVDQLEQQIRALRAQWARRGGRYAHLEQRVDSEEVPLTDE